MAMLVSLSALILAITPLSADALLASPKRDLPRSPEVCEMELSVTIARRLADSLAPHARSPAGSPSA